MATLTKTTDGKNPRKVGSLSDDEIGVMVGDLRQKLYTLRSQTVTDKVENNAQFTNIRRDIARLLTERTSRSNKAAKPAAKPAPKAAAKTTSKTAKAKTN